MSREIPTDSKWFHVRTLTPVKCRIIDSTADGQATVVVQPAIGDPFFVPVGEFLDCYHCDLPVSQSLLLQLGWQQLTWLEFVSGPVVHWDGTAQKNCRVFAFFGVDGSLGTIEVGITERTDENTTIVPVRTACELLTLLRSLGIGYALA